MSWHSVVADEPIKEEDEKTEALNDTLTQQIDVIETYFGEDHKLRGSDGGNASARRNEHAEKKAKAKLHGKGEDEQKQRQKRKQEREHEQEQEQEQEQETKKERTKEKRKEKEKEKGKEKEERKDKGKEKEKLKDKGKEKKQEKEKEERKEKGKEKTQEKEKEERKDKGKEKTQEKEQENREESKQEKEKEEVETKKEKEDENEKEGEDEREEEGEIRLPPIKQVEGAKSKEMQELQNSLSARQLRSQVLQKGTESIKARTTKAREAVEQAAFKRLVRQLKRDAKAEQDMLTLNRHAMNLETLQDSEREQAKLQSLRSLKHVLELQKKAA